MTELPTLGLLSVADGRLMSAIGDVYQVISFFIGRDAFTHELPMYGRKAEPLIIAQFPAFGARRELPWEQVRDEVLAQFGAATAVPDAWAGVLADGSDPIANLATALEARNDH